MGNGLSQPGGPGGGQLPQKPKKQKRKYKTAKKMTIGKKAASANNIEKIPAYAPTARCQLRLLKSERVHDFLLLEQMFVSRMQQSKAAVSLKERHMKELESVRGSPVSVGTLEEIIDDDHAIVSEGPEMCVPILSFVDRSLLYPGCTVLLHHRTSAVVGVLADNADPLVNVMKVDKAPTETFADIGGLEEQIEEMREAVELPLTRPELYEEVGIKPPKGVILYGPPGTGKTLLAKAVANSTSATFLRVTGSEMIKKYLGEGPRLVREMFKVAADNAPSIVFIDEIDAVGTKRYDAKSSGQREVQRTMLELLNQLDGFDAKSDVKVIMATNRIDSLDPALIRPGRIDRKIELPLPALETKRQIFRIHTKRMTLSPDVNFEEFIHTKDGLSGADIQAICTEAGLQALRERRMMVSHKDFVEARESVIYKKNKDIPEGLYL
ncbi:26S proteasome regulatory subunit 4 homolog A [Aduncisulcus paluster]|uniref:26S proteasome regulatory subunit 4 homolog A n=1 Tax=Aduncisulcus paluster TaxID=2918883 RepID=A0ABQ5K580_9EUKA|nr:26S proteasome regulatory subunit 4 homolog A [Aduncisulcus paluster]